MLTEQVKRVMRHNEPVTIGTAWEGGPHLVAAWMNYIEIIDDRTLAIPAGGYEHTEENLKAGSPIQLMMATLQEEGAHGPGLGFRLTGSGRVDTAGPIYERVFKRFPWARGALVVTVEKVEQIAGD
jgi:hypothetical protein